MYCTHFGFRFPPFRLTPNAEVFFEGAGRGAAVEALMHGIDHGDGVLQVVGAPGSGRTALCRVVQARLSGRTPCACLPDPRLTPHQAMHAIARSLGIGDGQGGDAGARLQRHLRACMQAGTHVVILIEEAQDMPVPTLEAIRLLCNLDTATQKAARPVLFGTRELDALLARHDSRQLRDRITQRIELAALSPAEVADYLALRLRRAGAREGLVSASAAHAIARASAGNPMRVNLLADRALMAAFAADTHDVTLRHARKGIGELAVERDTWWVRMQRWLRGHARANPALAAGAR